MSPKTPGLRPLVDSLRRVLRRDATLAVVFTTLSVLPVGLVVAWLIGWINPWSRPGIGPLLLDLLVVAGASGLALRGVRRWIRTVDERAIVSDVEQRSGMAEGALYGVLELEREVPSGASAALARRARNDLEQRFSGSRLSDLSGELGGVIRKRRGYAAAGLGTLSLLALALGLLSPEHSRAAWAPLASPVRTLTPPPLPPLAVEPGNATVHRGADLAVRVQAPGRSVVTLKWKMRGDVPREEIATVAGDSAVARVPRVDAPVEYWIEAPDGASTARYTVTPIDPLLLSELRVDVIYPAHVGRPAEHYNGEVPLLEVPEGTQLIVKGSATRALSDASLEGPDAGPGPRLRVDGSAFAGEWTPRQSGMYLWQLRDRNGEELAIRPAPVEIVVSADAAPQVEITYPEMDTVLDASLQQTVVADARDDYGFSSASLVSWRISSDGRRDPDAEQPIVLTGDDRFIIRTLLDASARELMPGDTLKFFIRVADNSPRRQTSSSRTVTLRLPGTAEMREQSTRDADKLLEQARELARSAGESQQATTALERRTAAANARRVAQQQSGSRGGDNEKMDFQDAAQARQVLEKQQQMLEQIEQMRQNLDALEQAMARAGLRDAELQKRMEELRQQLDEMLTPEMKKQIEQLQRALEQLDPEAVQKALEQMAKQQEELKEQLQRSAEMLERAATEQQINNLAQEARELAAQQEALSRDLAKGKPTTAQARQQEELAQKAQELAKALEEMQQKLQEQGASTAAERTESAEQGAQQAGQQMKQAAQDAARQDGQKASERGKEAAKQLEETAKSLDQARQAMADAQRDEVKQSLQQATSDAVSLAQQQQDLLEKLKQSEQNGQQQQGQQQQGQQQQGQQQQGQQQQGQQQQGQQQQGQQQQGQQQGQQQSGQQGQQQQGQQGQQQQGQQGQQRPGQQQGGQQQGQRPGQPGAQQPGQPGGQQQGGQQDPQSLRAEQASLQQGLQQLGRNLTEAAEQSAAVSRDVQSALARANLSMQETLNAMQRGQSGTQEAQRAVDDLNRLALSLLQSSQQLQQGGEAGSSGQQQQLADLAKQQSSLNGQSNALAPMNLSPQTMSQQMQQMAANQMDIARQLGNMNQGGRESPTAQIDALAREAAELARMLEGGAVPPEVRARQEKLFHKMLDAGRTLEKDEFEDERKAERAGRFDARQTPGLDARLFQDPTRFHAPTAEELQRVAPALRRLILDYFERLNRPAAPAPPQPEKPTGR